MQKSQFILTLIVGSLSLIGQFGCSAGVAPNAGNANQASTNKTTPGNANPNQAVPAVNSTNAFGRPPVMRSDESATAVPNETDNRIRFDKGATSETVEGGVIRGERMTYVVGARKGQTMSVNINALEDNVVFQIEAPGGKYLEKAGETDDATNWSGRLPRDGDYKIIVGGTRGNASFKLTVAIK